jgi:hypothetical protein
VAGRLYVSSPNSIGIGLLVSLFLVLCTAGACNSGTDWHSEIDPLNWLTVSGTEQGFSLSFHAVAEETLQAPLDTTELLQTPPGRQETTSSILPPLEAAPEWKTPLLEKDPTGALLRSLAFPGWGQVYTKNYLRGAVYGIGEVILIGAIYNFWTLTNEHKDNFEFAQRYNRGAFLQISGATLLPHDTEFLPPEIPGEQEEFDLYQRFQDKRNFYLWITAAWVFVSMFDAYVCAHLYNFEKLSGEEFAIDFRIEDRQTGRACKLTMTKRF